MVLWMRLIPVEILRKDMFRGRITVVELLVYRVLLSIRIPWLIVA